jgi:cytosine/adenosine deaminase-related metal-dependent hydrolase
MLKKSISAALVVIVMAWAEMAMAPMLAMHVWHEHAAHEMAAHHHAMPAELPCCPKIKPGKTADPALLEFAASSPACQDQHRCCFQQGPQNLPTPVKAGQEFSQDISLEEIAELIPTPTHAQISLDTQVSPGSPPELFGMIFRV